MYRNIKDSEIQQLEKQLQLTIEKIVSKKKKIVTEIQRRKNASSEVMYQFIQPPLVFCNTIVAALQ